MNLTKPTFIDTECTLNDLTEDQQKKVVLAVNKEMFLQLTLPEQAIVIVNSCKVVTKLNNRLNEIRKYTNIRLQNEQTLALATMMIVEYGLNILDDKDWIHRVRTDKKSKLKKEVVKVIQDELVTTLKDIKK